MPPPSRSAQPPSIFSHDIWLGDHSGQSSAFSRDVMISGWTNVGDELVGAFVGESLSSSFSLNTF